MKSSKKPLISFCIPTYNRQDKVYELVNNILRYQGDDIEVVVLDNCSTDNTEMLLKSIDDNRLNFISNSENIGGILNIVKVITEAKGDYSFLCLDKDFVDFNGIPNLINRLYSEEDVIFGYCALDIKKETQDKVFGKGFSSLEQIAYLGKHPSGNFYKTNVYRESKTLQQIFESKSSFEFNFELINAEFSYMGKSRVINIPIFSTEKKEDCGKIPSFTYNKVNLYFEPHKRINEYRTYFQSISSLPIDKLEIRSLVARLYFRGLLSSTLGYKAVLDDYLVCLHHGINSRKVGFGELVRIDIAFTKFFFRECNSVNFFRKSFIFMFAHMKVVIFMVKNKIRAIIKQK